MRSLFGIVALLMLVFCGTGRAAVVNPESLPIRSISIEMEGERSSQDLLSTLKTRAHERFSQNEFDQDLKLLAKEFLRVEPSVTVEDQQVVILIKLWKKPFIHEIVWKGNHAYPSDRLQRELGVAVGSIYDRQSFNQAIQKLRRFYVKKGFFESTVQYDVQHLQSKEVDITVTISEGRAGLVEDIRFTNVTPKEREELVARLMTKKYSFWFSWITNQGVYYKDVFRQDELTILSYFHNKGYLDAKVDAKLLPSSKRNDRIVIEISVDKGEMYHLGTVSIKGNHLFSTDRLLEVSKLSTGQVYSPDAVRVATHAMQTLYGAKGYIDVSIIPHSLLRENERIYDVKVTIEEGQRFRVGMIHIMGNTRTDARVILHETLLVPGDVFDSSLLEKSEERLRHIGYFKNVNVYAVRSSNVAADGVAFRDVHIDVEEVPNTARFIAFGGWNSSAGIAGGVGYSETNFRLAGITRVGSEGLQAMRGAGEYMNLSATLGTKQVSYELSWTKPYVFDTPWIFGVDLQKQRESYSSDSYTVHSYTATVSGKYPVNAFLTFGTHYRLHHSDIRLKGIKRHESRNKQLVRESRNDGTISAIGVSLIYDSTDHPILPTRGIRSTLSAEYAGLFGDHHFCSLGYQNSFFFTPERLKGSFRFRGDLRAIQPLFGTKARQLPMDERLYLGGDQTMRGFKYNYVGPKFRDVDRTPRGGMTSLLLSGEYERPIWKQLHGFVFCDAGNVWWQPVSVGSILYTAGFGARVYIAANTPLTFGMGYPLNPKSRRDVRHFFFSIGVSF